MLRFHSLLSGTLVAQLPKPSHFTQILLRREFRPKHLCLCTQMQRRASQSKRLFQIFQEICLNLNSSICPCDYQFRSSLIQPDCIMLHLEKCHGSYWEEVPSQGSQIGKSPDRTPNRHKSTKMYHSFFICTPSLMWRFPESWGYPQFSSIFMDFPV